MRRVHPQRMLFIKRHTLPIFQRSRPPMIPPHIQYMLLQLQLRRHLHMRRTGGRCRSQLIIERLSAGAAFGRSNHSRALIAYAILRRQHSLTFYFYVGAQVKRNEIIMLHH